MVDSSTAKIVVGSLGLAVVLAISTPALLTFYRKFDPDRHPDYQPIGDFYEDEDGKASEESQKKFSTFLPRLIVLVASMLGGLISIVKAVLETSFSSADRAVDEWLRFASWV